MVATVLIAATAIPIRLHSTARRHLSSFLNSMNKLGRGATGLESYCLKRKYEVCISLKHFAPSPNRGRPWIIMVKDTNLNAVALV